jgi:hypothetical protein
MSPSLLEAVKGLVREETTSLKTEFDNKMNALPKSKDGIPAD